MKFLNLQLSSNLSIQLSEGEVTITIFTSIFTGHYYYNLFSLQNVYIKFLIKKKVTCGYRLIIYIKKVHSHANLGLDEAIRKLHGEMLPHFIYLSFLTSPVVR